MPACERRRRGHGRRVCERFARPRAAAELTSPGPAAPGASLRWSAPCVPRTGS